MLTHMSPLPSAGSVKEVPDGAQGQRRESGEMSGGAEETEA